MIIQMKRITLIAHKSDEEAILKALQSTRAVQVIDTAEGTTDEAALAHAEEKVGVLSDALAILRPFAAKKGMLAPNPEATVQEITARMPEALSFSETLESISRELAGIKSEIDKNESLLDALRMWEGFPEDMQTYQTSKRVYYFTGLIGAADVDKLNYIDACTDYECFNEGTLRACVVACDRADQKAVASYLKSLDWTDYAFPKLSGTPKAASARLMEANRALAERKSELAQQLSEKASGSSLLVEEAFDAAVIERDRALAATELARTAATFHLEGWTPEDKLSLVEEAILSVTDAYSFVSREPNEDEVPPSYVENSNFVTPFEQITNLYSRPDPRGMDPTPYMAPFYVLLFGLMLSDTGYGLVLSILCALYVKLKKPTGMFGGIMRVLFWGGLSTMVWGVLVGTFFGMDFDTLFGTVDKFPLLVDPMTDPIMMLILCFGLGVLHILFGLALKMKVSFRDGDWQTAVFDNLSWVLIIVGLIAFAGAGFISIPALKVIGLVMAGAGALMILLFKGREKKNVFGRATSGLGELYQVTSYLSDILSYARLFALGIATGVIASVFNSLCAMLMTSPNIIMRILGIIVAIALLIALHLFNIGINTLGAFVHCARLQYVEFYGKFYDAGGREFKPLGYKTKHVNITGE